MKEVINLSFGSGQQEKNGVAAARCREHYLILYQPFCFNFFNPPQMLVAVASVIALFAAGALADCRKLIIAPVL